LLPRLAGTELLAPKLAQFTRDYPDVVLDITADDTHLDIVAGGYDAGIQFGEYIQKDMIAVRVSKDHRAAIVGSPAYFKSFPRPKAPRDLLSHRCINFRHGHGGDVYRWEFEKGRKSLSVAVNGPLIVDDVEIVIRSALDGIGLAFVGEDKVAEPLASGELVQISAEDAPLGMQGVPMSAVYRTDSPPGPAARWFIDQLKQGDAQRANETASHFVTATASAAEAKNAGARFANAGGRRIVDRNASPSPAGRADRDHLATPHTGHAAGHRRPGGVGRPWGGGTH